MTTWQTYYARASQPCSRRGILPCQKTIRNELLIYAFACLSLSETILHHWDQNLCRLQTGNPYCQHHSDYSHQQPTNNLEFCPKHRACSRILPCSDCQPVQSSIMFLSPLFVPSLSQHLHCCIAFRCIQNILQLCLMASPPATWIDLLSLLEINVILNQLHLSLLQ